MTKLKKMCVVLCTEIDYFGYSKIENTIKPSVSDIAVVKYFPLPKIVKVLHNFVDLTSYFKKFIKNLSVSAMN